MESSPKYPVGIPSFPEIREGNPFLYQAGYLTIRSYDKVYDLYVLGVPNTEVRVGLIRNLMPLYS
jgi:hypothetical protein